MGEGRTHVRSLGQLTRMNSRWHAHYKRQIAKAEQEIARLNSVVGRMFGERDDIDDDLADALAKYARVMNENRALGEEIRRLELLVPADKETVTQDQYNTLVAAKCTHCGGVHSIACPRIKRIRFQPGGQAPSEVEFFADNEWPKDNVQWIENIVVESPS